MSGYGEREGGHDPVGIDMVVSELIRESTDCADPDHYVILARIAMAAVERLVSVNHAGITLLGGSGVIRSLAASDGDPLVLDHIQRRCGEGPYFESDCQVIRVPDMTGESRWPSFVERAVALTRVRSILQFPLLADDRDRAWLNLYADRPGALDDVVEAGSVLARHAAQCLDAARTQRSAAANRWSIGSTRYRNGRNRWLSGVGQNGFVGFAS